MLTPLERVLLVALAAVLVGIANSITAYLAQDTATTVAREAASRQAEIDKA